MSDETTTTTTDTDVVYTELDELAENSDPAASDIFHTRKSDDNDVKTTLNQIRDFCYPPAADVQTAGLVTTGEQTIAGKKTFNSGIAIGSGQAVETPKLTLAGTSVSGVDTAVTSGSSNLITSNAVNSALANLDNSSNIYYFNKSQSAERYIYLGYCNNSSYQNSVQIEVNAYRVDGAVSIKGVYNNKDFLKEVVGYTNYIDLLMYNDSNTYKFYLKIGSYCPNVQVKISNKNNFTYQGTEVTTLDGTLVSSKNMATESYVTSALANLNNTRIATITDCNEAIPSLFYSTNYFIRSTGSNAPTKGRYFIVAKNESYGTDTTTSTRVIFQDAYCCDPNVEPKLAHYIRRALSTDSGSSWAWTDWEKVVTETNLSSALADYKTLWTKKVDITKNSSATLDISTISNARVYLLKIGSGNASAWRYCGILSKASLYPSLVELDKGLKLTVTLTDNNTITITNTDTSYDVTVNIEIV